MRVVLTILQNDCMLIFGRGDDGRGNLIDGKSLYLLETLPGMKFRGLKRKTKDEARGLASACLYLNLKLDHQYEGDQGRDLLKTIMRERYQHRFTDFTCLIQRRDAGINWKEAALFGCGRYGSTYGVPWTVGRRYDTLGNVCYNRYETGIVLIKIMANSEGESRVARDDMFCNRVSTPSFPRSSSFKLRVSGIPFSSNPSTTTLPATASRTLSTSTASCLSPSRCRLAPWTNGRALTNPMRDPSLETRPLRLCLSTPRVVFYNSSETWSLTVLRGRLGLPS